MKDQRIFILIAIFTLLFSSCMIYHGQMDLDYAEDAVDALFLDPAQAGLLKEKELVHLEVLYRDSITLLSDQDGDYVGFTLFPLQPKLNYGIRSEISVDYPFSEGDTLRYSWSFMIPEDFIYDMPEPQWWVVGQWHDQPDIARGETWDNYPGNSPPVSFYLGMLEGQFYLGFTYGFNPVTMEYYHLNKEELILLEPGTWLRLSTVISWSRTEGSVRVYLDDQKEPYINKKAANMLNQYQHYLKLGQYRHPDISSSNTVYYRDLFIEEL